MGCTAKFCCCCCCWWWWKEVVCCHFLFFLFLALSFFLLSQASNRNCNCPPRHKQLWVQFLVLDRKAPASPTASAAAAAVAITFKAEDSIGRKKTFQENEEKSQWLKDRHCSEWNNRVSHSDGDRRATDRQNHPPSTNSVHHLVKAATAAAATASALCAFTKIKYTNTHLHSHTQTHIGLHQTHIFCWMLINSILGRTFALITDTRFDLGERERRRLDAAI